MNNDSRTSEESAANDTLRQKFDAWYASPRGEAQFTLGMHYMGWAYICYAEGYKQAAVDGQHAMECKALGCQRAAADNIIQELRAQNTALMNECFHYRRKLRDLSDAATAALTVTKS